MADSEHERPESPFAWVSKPDFPRRVVDHMLEISRKVAEGFENLKSGNHRDLFHHEQADAGIVLLIKPMGMEFGVEEKVRNFIHQNGGVIANEWSGIISAQQISRHYGKFADKKFFPDLIRYYTGESTHVFHVKVPEDRIKELRRLLGINRPSPGSFRFDMIGEYWQEALKHVGVIDNALHMSDAKDTGADEIAIWFGVPPIKTSNPFTIQAHEKLWKMLRRLEPNTQFSGSLYNGTAIPNKPDDLDYRLLTDNVYLLASKISKIPGMRLDKSAVDPEGRGEYIKFEYEWKGGKADIAIVPKESYRYSIPTSAMTYHMSEEWKTEAQWMKQEYYAMMLRIKDHVGKDSSEYRAAKNEYQNVKRVLNLEVKKKFGLLDRRDKKRSSLFSLRKVVPHGFQTIDILTQASHRQAGLQKGSFLDDVRDIAQEMGQHFPEEVSEHVLKSTISIRNKLHCDPCKIPSDLIRSTIVLTSAKSPEDAQLLAIDCIELMAQRGYKVYFDCQKNKHGEPRGPSIKDRFANPLPNGYADISIKFIKEGKRDPIVKEVQLIQPTMLKVKEKILGHQLYKLGQRSERLQKISTKVQKVLYAQAFKHDNKGAKPSNRSQTEESQLLQKAAWDYSSAEEMTLYSRAYQSLISTLTWQLENGTRSIPKRKPDSRSR